MSWKETAEKHMISSQLLESGDRKPGIVGVRQDLAERVVKLRVSVSLVGALVDPVTQPSQRDPELCRIHLASALATKA